MKDSVIIVVSESLGEYESMRKIQADREYIDDACIKRAHLWRPVILSREGSVDKVRGQADATLIVLCEWKTFLQHTEVVRTILPALDSWYQDLIRFAIKKDKEQL